MPAKYSQSRGHISFKGYDLIGLKSLIRHVWMANEIDHQFLEGFLVRQFSCA